MFFLRIFIVFFILSKHSYSEDGYSILDSINKLYSQTSRDCGKPSQPAFLCSGIILRAIFPSNDYNFWEPSPKSMKSGGISVSYLRKDSKYKKLAYGLNSGYFLYPIFSKPRALEKYNVLCFFPLDAVTDHRTNSGCNDSSLTDDIERFCHETEIKISIEKKFNIEDLWIIDYINKGSDHSRQCSFDVSDDRNEKSGPDFYSGILSMKKLGQESFNLQNELRIKTWKPDPQKSPPIMVLFYTDDNGIDSARLYQIQWYIATKQIKPIINLQLPDKLENDAKFSFKHNDQALYPIKDKNTCDRYIDNFAWAVRYYHGLKKHLVTLKVTPTDCGRRVNNDQTNNFFNELVSNYYFNDGWYNNPDNKIDSIASMRSQLVCHFVIAREKETWNLEPSLKYISPEESIKEKCNNV
ncbi:DUF2599 domain-containing protein [Arsenophonus sp.]|uniref:DUF2599 domain-containing protein n=1 Tax=Arsenophonus sp. TaxID=1872640 RepID=UPI0028667272|nr:DUF2599 domain-containing protein [Arsenophonus sp.]MDR5617868.1 DUF2599 domain-containing protein [Arsenophonus sp.]